MHKCDRDSNSQSEGETHEGMRSRPGSNFSFSSAAKQKSVKRYQQLNWQYFFRQRTPQTTTQTSNTNIFWGLIELLAAWHVICKQQQSIRVRCCFCNFYRQRNVCGVLKQINNNYYYFCIVVGSVFALQRIFPIE